MGCLPQYGSDKGHHAVEVGETWDVDEGNAPWESSRNRPKKWGVTHWWFGPVLDPRAGRVKVWRRVFFMFAAFALAIDPCFFYTFMFDGNLGCLTVQFTFANILCILRTITDTAYLANSWMTLHTAYLPKRASDAGQFDHLVMSPRSIVWHHVRSMGGLAMDIFVILPVPQVFFWAVIPLLYAKEQKQLQTSSTANQLRSELARLMVVVATFMLVQYVFKILHTFRIVARSQRINGYLFASAWWGFGLNLALFGVCAHVFGSLWYFLAADRVLSCTRLQCNSAGSSVCQPSFVSCLEISADSVKATAQARAAWAESSQLTTTCFSSANSDFTFGIYSYAAQLMTDTSSIEKVLYGLFFGVMTLSTFGNALEPSTNVLETAYALLMIVSGLLLFTLLIGNVGVFLQSVTERMVAMQLHRRDMDTWMRRKGLGRTTKRKVRRQQRHVFAATQGVEEEELLAGLPGSLRREVKREVCEDLVRSVPFFCHLEAVVLDSLCERLRSVHLVAGSRVVQHGEPVTELLFVVSGNLKSEQAWGEEGEELEDETEDKVQVTQGKSSRGSSRRRGWLCLSGPSTELDISCKSRKTSRRKVQSALLGPGSVCGEELLSWGLGEKSFPVGPSGRLSTVRIGRSSVVDGGSRKSSRSSASNKSGVRNVSEGRESRRAGAGSESRSVGWQQRGEESVALLQPVQADPGRLPLSASTITAVSNVEGFVLSSEDLQFITSHYMPQLREGNVQNAVRQHSPQWQMWAAVTIQTAWKRSVARSKRLASATSTSINGRPNGPLNGSAAAGGTLSAASQKER